jgi:TRAP-type C4-dicarboxylate transport system substrate-binding protein
MKGSRSGLSLLLLSILAVSVGLVSAPASADTITLSYANFPPAPTFPCVQMERWKTEVERRTAGRVTVNTFPGGTLLGAKEMFDGVVAGQADIGCLCMAYQPGRFVVTNATGLPLGIPDARSGSLALLDLYKRYQPEEFAPVKVLAMFTTAQSNIMSKVPVRRLEDIQGVSLRGSGPAAAVLGALGANPVGMPMSDTPEALQKGVVKGLLSSLEVLKDFKYAESCRYVTLVDTVIYPFAVVMNRDRWNSLPPEVQKVLDDLVAEQSEWTGNYMDGHVKESVEWSRSTYQVELIELPAEEKARWDARLQPMTAKWVAEASQKGLPAEAILADLQAMVAKHRQ